MALPQGLAALLVQGLSGCRPEEVANLAPDWISTIGLQQSLTPSRTNGFLNMFGLMRHKAAQLVNEQVQLRFHSACKAASRSLDPPQASSDLLCAGPVGLAMCDTQGISADTGWSGIV